MDPLSRPFTFDRVVRMMITALVIIGLYFLIDSISGALLPFLIAWLIAYMMHPLVDFIQNKLRVRHRGTSIVLSFLIIILTVGGGVFALIPIVSEEAAKLTDIIQHNIPADGYLQFLPAEIQRFIKFDINWDQILRYLNHDDWSLIMRKVFPKLWDLFSGSFALISTIVASFIILLYIFFILLDYERIAEGSIALIPAKYRSVAQQLLKDLEYSMNRYFRGQALVASLVGILFAIGFAIIGLPLGIVLGLFIGLLNMVPYLQIIGVIPTVLLCVLKSVETGSSFVWTFAAAMAVFAVVQLIQDMIIVPKVMGKVTGMNPAVILLSLSIWGSLLGMVGMIIALPMTTLLLSYYSRYILNEKEEGVAPSASVKETEPPAEKG